jgi:hypothetical protein
MSDDQAIQIIDVVFQPGAIPSEGVIRIEYSAGGNARSTLTLPLIEAMLLLQQLDVIRRDVGIEFPSAGPG